MCFYYKYVYKCNCISETKLQRCRVAVVASESCRPIDDPPTVRSQCRPSFAPCFDCIVAEAQAENLATAEGRNRIELGRKAREEEKVKARKAVEMQEKKDRVKKEYGERAATERLADRARENQLRLEAEHSEQGEGLWMDVGSARKKGRSRGLNGGSGQLPPLPAPPMVGVRRVEATGTEMSLVRVQGGRRGGNSLTHSGPMSGSGRAGVWGKGSSNRMKMLENVKSGNWERTTEKK